MACTDLPRREDCMTASVAFVTVSYAPDRDRCAFLSRSLDALAPSVEHYIVVDRADRGFRLAREQADDAADQGGSTADLAPASEHAEARAPLQSMDAGAREADPRLARPATREARVRREARAEVLVHADSDVVFMRPFELSSVVDREGRVRLCMKADAIDAGLPNHVRWHRTAERLLAIGRAELPLPDFISGLVPWRRVNAVALLEHIERTTGRPWLRAIAAASHVSEYTLYGRFVTDALSERGQFRAASLCHDYYTRAPLSPTSSTPFSTVLHPTRSRSTSRRRRGWNRPSTPPPSNAAGRRIGPVLGHADEAGVLRDPPPRLEPRDCSPSAACGRPSCDA